MTTFSATTSVLLFLVGLFVTIICSRQWKQHKDKWFVILPVISWSLHTMAFGFVTALLVSPEAIHLESLWCTILRLHSTFTMLALLHIIFLECRIYGKS